MRLALNPGPPLPALVRRPVFYCRVPLVRMPAFLNTEAEEERLESPVCHHGHSWVCLRVVQLWGRLHNLNHLKRYYREPAMISGARAMICLKSSLIVRP